MRTETIFTICLVACFLMLAVAFAGCADVEIDAVDCGGSTAAPACDASGARVDMAWCGPCERMDYTCVVDGAAVSGCDMPVTGVHCVTSCALPRDAECGL